MCYQINTIMIWNIGIYKQQTWIWLELAFPEWYIQMFELNIPTLSLIISL